MGFPELVCSIPVTGAVTSAVLQKTFSIHITWLKTFLEMWKDALQLQPASEASWSYWLIYWFAFGAESRHFSKAGEEVSRWVVCLLAQCLIYQTVELAFLWSETVVEVAKNSPNGGEFCSRTLGCKLNVISGGNLLVCESPLWSF